TPPASGGRRTSSAPGRIRSSCRGRFGGRSTRCGRPWAFPPGATAPEREPAHKMLEFLLWGARNAGNARMQVLFVDPNDESRDNLRRTLASLGYQVRGFATVAEGTRALAAADFEPSLLIVALDAADGDPDELLSGARARDPRLLTLALVD